MKRTAMLQEIRIMRFEELYRRQQAGRLTQGDGRSAQRHVGTVRRWVGRYKEEGAAGLLDQHLRQ